MDKTTARKPEQNSNKTISGVLENGFDKVLTASGYLAAILVVISSFIVAYDVFARRLFDSPTRWGFEYSVYLIAAAACFSFAYVSRENRHISIDLLVRRLSEHTRSLVKFFTLFCSTLIGVALIYSSWQLLSRSISSHAVSSSSMETPLWIPQSILLIGLMLLTIQLLRMTCHQGKMIGQGNAGVQAAPAKEKKSGLLRHPVIMLVVLAVLFIIEFVLIAGSGNLRVIGVVLLLLTFLAAGAPIFISLALTGGIAFMFILNHGINSLSQMAPLGNQTLTSSALTAIPLFVFGAEILACCGFTEGLFNLIEQWMPPMRGKLAIATILACGVFAAACGSSPATAAAFSMIAIPSMLSRNYDKRLAYGTVAAGGTLGPMIPPSLGPIIFGQLTGLSVSALLMAGLVPGILMIIVFSLYIFIKCFRDKRYDNDVKGEKISWADRWNTFKAAGPALGAPVIIIGGIYSGITTPTEAASLLVVYAILMGLITKRLKLPVFKKALASSILTSTMIYAIAFGATIFSASLSFLRAPQTVAAAIGGLSVPPLMIIAFIIILIFILGMFMDAISIILITTPILFPIITKLGFDGIWFCTLFNLCLEVGFLIPPMGLNLYVLAGATKDKLDEIIMGTFPFVVCLFLCISILVAFPILATWLPGRMGF